MLQQFILIEETSVKVNTHISSMIVALLYAFQHIYMFNVYRTANLVI